MMYFLLLSKLLYEQTKQDQTKHMHAHVHIQGTTQDRCSHVHAYIHTADVAVDHPSYVSTARFTTLVVSNKFLAFAVFVSNYALLMSPSTRSSVKAQEEAPSSAAKSATQETCAASQTTGTVHTLKISPLSHLTTQSSRFGVWEVAVFNPIARAQEYLWNGEKRLL